MSTIKYRLATGTTREEMAPKFLGETVQLPEYNGYKPVVFADEDNLFACRAFGNDTFNHWYCFILEDNEWKSLGIPPWNDEILLRIRHAIDRDWVGRPCREVKGLANELKYKDNRYEMIEYLDLTT